MRASARCRLLLPPRGDLGRCLRTSPSAALQRSLSLPLHTNATIVSAPSPDNDDVIGKTVCEDGISAFTRLRGERFPRTNATTTATSLSSVDDNCAFRSSLRENDVTGWARHSSKWFNSPHNRNQARLLYTTAVDAPPKSSLSSVDESDVSRFSRFSEEWWDERGALKPLHSLNEARVPWIRDTLMRQSSKDEDGKSTLAGFRVLDVGCGAGLLSEPLARLGADVIGLDAGDDAINVARDRARQDSDLKKAKIKYECTSVERYVAENPKMAGSFDAIVASEVIEHVASLESFLEACIELAKPGAHLFFTTLNRTLLSRFAAIWLAEEVLRIVPRGVHDWKKFVPPDDLAAQLEARGCNVRLVNGLFYNPLVNKWSWVGDTSVNYALLARKEEGILDKLEKRERDIQPLQVPLPSV